MFGEIIIVIFAFGFIVLIFSDNTIKENYQEENSYGYKKNRRNKNHLIKIFGSHGIVILSETDNIKERLKDIKQCMKKEGIEYMNHEEIINDIELAKRILLNNGYISDKRHNWFHKN